ncbi:efflux RND transporter permease subunit [Membranihabitans maritimus]|uniref:efflux RND transporter permease subunit n=1 Tax=Membranihabitans maritimus TaxID=2904244 RepID=UPI001F02B15A|nr:efflux RND transporter permease subunit [Membranihabitans maritimus]
MLKKFINVFLDNKIIVVLLFFIFVGWGVITSPFDYKIPFLPSDPVPVDAIPDLGENQQIVFTEWPGRSPQDVEDQITYPLTSALLGVPGVKSVRSSSMFGLSSIYLIFEEDVEFYWSRSRILEKLNALPEGVIPDGVSPALGPDATALGQIFWYTLEGRDREGNPTGGWDLHELRSIQDFYVKYGLSATQGVAEVASVGGFVKEYQVDMDPEAMRIHGVSITDIMNALKKTNSDVGAQTLEINNVEYFIRGLGYVKSIEDIEQTVLKETETIPVTVSQVAKVNIGPATRRGILDKSGSEAVGGVVVARYGSNPMAVIGNVKEKIAEISNGLPSKTLEDGTVSQVTVVPFYDRSELINETIGTLDEALRLELLVSVIVIILLLFNIRSSIIVSLSIPISVLLCFVAMKYFGVDANIVALSGIAIAIGTMADMGIVVVESVVNRREEFGEKEELLDSIRHATHEVAGAITTAMATTIISFLPVFAMEAAEGKLFRPLAFTKTFALMASIIVTLVIVPTFSYWIYSLRSNYKWSRIIVPLGLFIMGAGCFFFSQNMIAWVLVLVAFLLLIVEVGRRLLPQRKQHFWKIILSVGYGFIGVLVLAKYWIPLGVEQGLLANVVFLTLVIGALVGVLYSIMVYYERLLRFVFKVRWIFLIVVVGMIFMGVRIMMNTGKEFMPSLDEGSFLLMPTSMPHSGVQENLKNLQLLDMAVTSIPEVKSVVGKAGRVNSSLDPAPLSMYENVILYEPEYKTNEKGYRIRFKVDEQRHFIRNTKDELIPDPNGQYYRNWRAHINSPDDIWNEIVEVTKLPGVTSAPKLQPIETRLVMLQTGMRAPMGIKVRGNKLNEIEDFGRNLEPILKDVDGVKESAVFADRIVGKPYLLIDINRQAIARYGLTISDVQNYIQAGIGGMKMSQTVEGRERYNIRVRLPRSWRNSPEQIQQILIRTSSGAEIPLSDVADIRYEQGPQSIKSEDGFLVGYVLFDKEDGYAEGEVVENAQAAIEEAIAKGKLERTAGISYAFAGNYQQQIRANKKLTLVLPISLLVIFLVLFFHFRSVPVTAMVFSGVFVAFAGGFIMIWLYGQPWFMDFDMFGSNMRDLFQIHEINLSVAVWVGFLALAGIATDDGVLMGTFIQNSIRQNQPQNYQDAEESVIQGGLRRVRPAMMTTATTILALLPVLSSTGRGSDIMVPMAIPSFGGMVWQIITMFTVPVLYNFYIRWSLRNSKLVKA